MKKIIQIFATIILLCIVLAADAGTDRHHKPTDPSPEYASTLRTSFKPGKRIGGEMILTVLTLDVNGKPLQGALVTAACTGQAAKYSDAKGIVTFNLGTSCPCNEDGLTVTTSKGCYQQIKVSCGQYTVQCNQ